MATVGLVCATTVVAGEDGWYVFGAIGETTNNSNNSALNGALTSVGATNFSSGLSTPAVYNLDVGYQVNNNFALEGGYIGSTSQTYNTGVNLAGSVSASAKFSGWTLVAVGIMPLDDQFNIMGLSVPDHFSLLGKLGVSSITDSANASGPFGSTTIDSTKTDLTYGVGLKYDFSDTTSMRLSLDSYSFGDSAASSRIIIWTVGAGYQF